MGLNFEKISRRDFLKDLASLSLCLGFIDGLSGQENSRDSDSKTGATTEMVEARYYKKTDQGKIQCHLCFRRCLIENGKRGFCRNRLNRDGILYTLIYNRPCALQIDPIEKEPMYHFLPGTKIFCIGTASCNFRCLHCHNWPMSQRPLEETENYYIKPVEIVRLVREHNCPTLSFTYNEPTVFFEYIFDIVKLAKKEGLKAIFHSNGALGDEPLRDILKIIDGITIDLKGFTEKVYSEGSSAKLEPVLENLKLIRKSGVWLEIVNLLIPTRNDNRSDIKKMCKWINQNLGPDTPLHFSRFFPNYKLLNLSPTPIETLEDAYQIAKDAGLNYISIGNLPGHRYNSTFCPQCGKVLIQRTHFTVHKINIKSGKCQYCQLPIPGRWQ